MWEVQYQFWQFLFRNVPLMHVTLTDTDNTFDDSLIITLNAVLVILNSTKEIPHGLNRMLLLSSSSCCL